MRKFDKLVSRIIFPGFFILLLQGLQAQTYQWGNKFGATDDQVGTRAHLDPTSGKSFTSGHFKGSVDFDPGAGTTTLTSGTGYNAYIASYTSTGTLVWAKSIFSTAGESYITGFVTDASLNVYVSGYFKSQIDIDPDPNTTNNITSGGQQYDAFVMKLSSSGAYVWHKTFGTTSSDDRARDITLDAANNVILVGHSGATTLDVDPGAGTVNITGVGHSNLGYGTNIFGFVVKLNNAGNYVSHFQQASTYYLTEYFFTRVKADPSNNIYVTGSYARDDAYGGSDDRERGILFKLNPAMAILTEKHLMDPTQNANFYETIIRDIELDATGTYYYLTGSFNGNIGFGTASNGYNITLNSTNLNVHKTWIAKFNATGVVQWAKAIGGATIPTSIDLDNSSNVYISGYHSGTVDFNPASGLTSNSTSHGGNDGFLVKLNDAGSFTGNLQKIAGQDNDVVNDVSVNSTSGDYVIAGGIQSSNVDFNPGVSNNSLSSLGGFDAYLAKYTPCSMPVPPVNTTPAGDLSVCSGASATLTVADQPGAAFSWYSIANGGLQTSTGLSKTVTPSSTNSYYVQAANSCGTTNRTEIIVTVAGSSVTPTLTASTTSPSSICAGTSVTISTSQTNGGTPTYQWFNNATLISGQTGATFTSTTLPAGSNSITCTMTSNAACRTVNTVTSSPIVITVNASTTPAVSISAPQSTICNGSALTFTAVPTGGGAGPLYQWKVNGTNQGGNTVSNTFTSTTLSNNSIVSCVMTSNASCLTSATAASNSLTITVSPSQVPTASISAAQTTICTGGNASFTATATNAGANPTYQWKLNGSNIGGATLPTYSSSALTNGASITCMVTSNATCAAPTTATSNAITMTVVSSVTPAISISASQTTICPGTTINFTATPTNGGTVPAYQWKLNGSNIGGATASTYSSGALTNGAQITCVLTSNNSCASPATATSNTLTITVSGVVVPSVAISAAQTTVCQGDPVNLSATPTNGGLAPTYQWKKNTVNISGATSSTYSTTSAINGDVFSCVLTSADPCASPASVSSNNISISVTNSVTASVSISTPTTIVCSGVNVTFTATPVNGGSSPSYQWKVNGNNVGTNSNTYSTTTLNNGDVVSCVLSSNIACLANPAATSNSITMTVNNTTVPVISTYKIQNTICDSDTLDVYALSSGGGSSPAFQWKVNNVNTGNGNSDVRLSNLSNGDIITCTMISSETCASPASVTSANLVASVRSSAGNTNVISADQTNICQGDVASFSSTVSGSASSTNYQWYINGSEVNGATTNSFNTYYVGNNDDVYCIISSISECGALAIDTSNIETMTVGATGQTTYISINTANNAVCSTDTIIFSTTTFHPGKTPVFNWYVNGNLTSTTPNEFVTEDLNDGDVVYCELVSSDACLTTNTYVSNSVTMTVGQTTTPDIILTVTDSMICAGQSVTFDYTYTGGGTAPVINWYKINNGTTPFAGSTSYTTTTLMNNDTIAAVLINNDFCAIPNFDIAKISMQVGVDNSVTTGSGTLTANMAGATYQWIDCNNGNLPIAGATNQSYSPSVSGNYAAIVDIGGCSATSSCINFIITGSETATTEASVLVYPNPAGKQFTIKYENSNSFNVELIDHTGKVVYTTTSNGNQLNIDTSLMTNDLYLVKITSGEKVMIQKLIINN